MGLAITGVFAVRTRAFLASGAFGGVRSGPESGAGRYEGVGGDGTVFHVPLHLETFGDHSPHHVAKIFVVDEVARGEFVDANVGSGLGGDVELSSVEPFGCVGDAFFVVGLRSQPKLMRNVRGMARVSIWSPVMRPYPSHRGRWA